MTTSKFIAALVIVAGCMAGFANGQSGPRNTAPAPAQMLQGSGARPQATQGSGVKPMATQGAGAKPMPAQGSGAKPMAAQGSGAKTMTTQGSGDRNQAGPTLALNGFCPVSIRQNQKWVRGTEQFKTTYDGKIYHFPSQAALDMFLGDPAKFTPVLGGDSIINFVKDSSRVPGSVNHASLYEGHVYLFPTEAERTEFRNHPAKYVNRDLAYGGMCSVCKIDMNKDEQGNGEIASLHHGLRYLFPSEEERNVFLSNPDKYAVK